jgi:hypothetical protein
LGKKFETATDNLKSEGNMNNTFELVTDLTTGQQVYESKEHKLQVAFSDCKPMDKDEANEFINNNGNSWRLPSVQEFDLIYKEMFSYNIGNFSESILEYWTNKYENESGLPQLVWGYHLEFGKSLFYNRTEKLGIRLVRSI